MTNIYADNDQYLSAVEFIRSVETELATTDIVGKIWSHYC